MSKGYTEASLSSLLEVSTMNNVWRLQDAKNRLSEVINAAIEIGPQTVTRRGQPTAVVVSIERFRQMSASRGDLVSFFRDSPLAGSDLELGRDDDFGRGVEV